MTNKKTKQPVATTNLLPSQNGLLVSTRVKVLLVFLVGLVLTLLTIFIVHDQYTRSLSQRVESMAALLGAERVEKVKNSPQTISRDESTLKQQLQQARFVNDDARYIYLMAITNTNMIYYLVDSEITTQHNGASDRGKGFAAASEGLKAAFYTGSTLIEGPRTDQHGSWLSASAPVRNTQGRVVAMVGMDIPIATYYRTMALAALIPVFGSLLVMSVFVMTDAIRRRRQEAVRMRSELVSIASHELRTPLTGIRWGQESLLRAKLPKENHDTLQSMYDSTIRLQESIEDILQLANWQAGRSQTLLITSTDIVTIVAGIFATQKLPAAQKNVTLEYARSWPKKLVLDCDAQRLKRVFNNLISNSIKYARPNTAVTVGYEKIGREHVISITDRGIGIPKSEQEKVFAGFYRASNAINHETGGTGMGLYMSRSAIEQHGGKLWLASEENKGTTVYIKLPK